MADQKISAMTAAVSVGDADLVPIVQAGLNKRATVAQILDGVVTELDPTLTALAALDSSAGYLKQTGADAFSKVTEFSVTDMVALRTFIAPTVTAVTLGGGFYSRALFRVTLGTQDAASGSVTVTVKLTEATDSGAVYYEAPFIIQRDPANGMSGSVPSGLVRSAYVGSAGTSVSVIQGQFTTLSPNSDFSLLIQMSGFVAPAVEMSALIRCPGDAVITIV